MHEIILALIRGIYLCPSIWTSAFLRDASLPLKATELSPVICLAGGVIQTFSTINVKYNAENNYNQTFASTCWAEILLLLFFPTVSSPFS